MRLARVEFVHSVRVDGVVGSQTHFGATDKLAITVESPFVRLQVAGPHKVCCVPMANIRFCEPLEDEKPEAKKGGKS